MIFIIMQSRILDVYDCITLIPISTLHGKKQEGQEMEDLFNSLFTYKYNNKILTIIFVVQIGMSDEFLML